MCSLDVLVEAVAAPEWAEVCGVPWLSPRLAAGFVGARVGLLCSAPLGVPAGFSAACMALVVPPGRLQHTFSDILRAAAFVPQLRRLPVLPREDGDQSTAASPSLGDAAHDGRSAGVTHPFRGG